MNSRFSARFLHVVLGVAAFACAGSATPKAEVAKSSTVPFPTEAPIATDRAPAVGVPNPNPLPETGASTPTPPLPETPPPASPPIANAEPTPTAAPANAGSKETKPKPSAPAAAGQGQGQGASPGAAPAPSKGKAGAGAGPGASAGAGAPAAKEALPAYAGPDPCTLATKGDSPVAKACSEGGVKSAKVVMKELVKEGRAAGVRYQCDDCHINDADYAQLSNGATEKFARLLAVRRK